MKTCGSARIWLLLCLLVTSNALGQERYEILLEGTRHQTNGNGKFVAQAVTTEDLMQTADAAPEDFTLVYHVNGSSFGDTIDLVNKRTGHRVDWVYGFYFGEDRALGRAALTNATGTLVRRVDYVYSRQSPYAQGSAFMVKRRPAGGALKVQGQLQFMLRPENGRPAQILQLRLETRSPFTTTP